MTHLKKLFFRIAVLLLPGLVCMSFAGKPVVGFDGGSINNTYQSVAINAIPALLTATSATGCSGSVSYQWQQSTDGISFVDIPHADSINHQHGAISKTTYFRRKAICSGTVAYTNNIAKIATFESGCINNPEQAVWYTTTPSPILATPATGGIGAYKYQWQISTDSIHFKDMVGDTLQNLSFAGPLSQTTYFQRKDRSGSEVQYTQKAIVFVYNTTYTACSNYSLYLTGTSGNAIATLKADSVISRNGHSIGEYVVEWYKDSVYGLPKFTSGSAGATDPAVSVSQPFAGEPAEGGVWHPVIKYVYVDGIKYSRVPMPRARYSPDLTHCLDSVIVLVNNLNCANGGNVTSVYSGNPYSHKITYVNGLNSPTLAARSFKFELDSANKYFAWWFTGYQERDKMKITYVSPVNNTSTVIEWWEVGYGSGAGPNVTTSPKIMQSTYMYKISSLTGFAFASGDYLLIEITPSANSNTNWEFLCKCFSSATIDYIVWDGTQRAIAPGSVTMAWNPSDCSYEVKYKKQATPFTSYSTSNFLKYNFISSYGTENLDTVRLKLYKQTGTSTYATHDFSSCAPLASAASVTKSGNTLTMVFSNTTDYNLYKNQLATIQGNANMSNYDSNDTKLNHYKFYYIFVYRGNSCGDAQTLSYFVTHVTNTPSFNDGTLTMTWTLTTKTNNYADSSCNQTWATINSWVQSCNYSASSSSDLPTVTTKLRGGAYPFTGLYINQSTLNELQKTFRYTAFAPSIDILDLSTKQWTNQYMPNYQWEYSHVYDRVTITNPADPIHNFRLERLMDANGMQITNPANYIKVYEIINGVVQ